MYVFVCAIVLRFLSNSYMYALFLLYEPDFPLEKQKLYNRSADGVEMTGNKCPDISAPCQDTSERLLVRRDVERVSPDLPCQCEGGLGSLCQNKAT